MTTPFISLPELAAAQSQPETTLNTAHRLLEASLQIEVLDKDLDTPPASPAASARYIIPAGAAGAWANKTDLIAFLMNSVWTFLTPRPGWFVYVRDEAAYYYYSGSAWEQFTAGSGGAAIVSHGGTTLTATAAASGKYTRFLNDAAKTYTFDDGEGYVVGTEYHGRNVGAGELLIATAGGMVVNAPYAGTLVIPQDGTFTVKIVASDEADLIGVTRPDGGTT